MLDYEILHCDTRIKTLDRAIKRHEASTKLTAKRKAIDYKIEKEKTEIARNDLVDLANTLRGNVEKEIKKRSRKDNQIVIDFLTHSYSLDVVAKHFKMTEEEVIDVLMDFSKSLCHRLKYINFNEYFDI